MDRTQAEARTMVLPAGYWGAAVTDVVGVAGLVALGAWIRFPLPFSPVPVTLQTFSVLLASYLVAQRRAAVGIGLYLALGLTGAPLFAVPSGATIGYLAAFVTVPHVVTRFRHPMMGMVAASGIILGLGAAWLALWLRVNAIQAILLGVVPFVPGDMLKLLAAYGLVTWLTKKE